MMNTNTAITAAALLALASATSASAATATALNAPNAATSANAKTNAEETISLPEVEVRAQAQKSGTGTEVNGAQLENSNSLADIVRYQPLVSAPGTSSGVSRARSSFERGGTTGYNIRGIEGNRIGMDLDGVELPQATTRPYVSRAGSNTFGMGRDFIDPEMYSIVNIDSGTTGAARPSGGIGGAVSFKTKSSADLLRGGKTSFFESKLGYDSADRSRHEAVTASGRSGNLDGLLVYSRRDGHQERNNSSTVPSATQKWHSDALLLKGGVQLDNNQHLQLSLDLYRRSNQGEFFNWDADNTNITESANQTNSTKRHTLQLSHLWTPTSSWVDSLDTRLHWQQTDMRDDTDTTVLASGVMRKELAQNKTRSLGFSSTGTRQIERHQLSFGVNASQENQERPWSVAYAMKPQPDTATKRYGAFIQDEIGLELAGQRLTLTPALRLDRTTISPRNMENFAGGRLTLDQAEELYSGTTSQTTLSPSLSAAFALRPQFFAYAQYQRGGRMPSAGEIYGSWNLDGGVDRSEEGPGLLGNRNLKPEKSDSFELGLKGSPAPGVQLNTSVFYTRYEDFIGFTRYTRAMHPQMFEGIPSHRTQLYRAENRDKATIYGFELFSRLDHGTWTPSLSGVYSTWGVGISQGNSISKFAGDKKVPLETVLPRKAVVGVGYDAPNKSWGMNLIGTFVAAKQAKETNRDTYTNVGQDLQDSSVERFRVPGYGVFDVAAYWQINKNVRLNAGINNLTNKRYWDYSSARRLEPSTPRDQRDIELLTNPGRTGFISVSAVF